MAVVNMCLRNIFKTNRIIPGLNMLSVNSFRYLSSKQVFQIARLTPCVSRDIISKSSLINCRKLTAQTQASYHQRARSYTTCFRDSKQFLNTTWIRSTNVCGIALYSTAQNPGSNQTQPIPPSDPTVPGKEGAPAGGKKDSWYSGKNAWKVGFGFITVTGVILSIELLYMWGRPQRDADGNEILDEFSNLPKIQSYPMRAWKEVHIFTKLKIELLLQQIKMIQEPSSEKLLPDVLKEPWYQPPYTLVLEMTGILVHPDWTLGTGWRFKKRPALDYFLQQIGPPMFEVVVYTHEQGFTAFPIIDGLDPNGHIMFRLFRDATRYVHGTHVKDLACLNRDLSKVIIIDCDPKALSLQPENAFLLKKWNGDDKDRTLVDLAAFLQTIAMSKVDDVRPVLEYYSQFDDPIAAFKENQSRILEKEREKAKKAVEPKKSLTPSWSLSGLTRRS